MKGNVFCFLFVVVVYAPRQLTANKLTVLTCFFTGKWQPGGFSTFEKLLFESEKLKSRYESIESLDIKLGTGKKEEELRSGWTIIDGIKKAFWENSSLEKVVKGYEKTKKKEKVAIVASSTSGVLVRAALQACGDELPFICDHLVTVCSPHAGIYTVPPNEKSDNPVERVCTEVQKFTTDSLMADATSSPDNPATPPFWKSYGAAVVGSLYDLGKIAWNTLYNQTAQQNWISLWRDPRHLTEYRTCETLPFLPFFNNELVEGEANRYKEVLFACQKRLQLTRYFDFIASGNDQFITPETSLCKELVAGKKNIYEESNVLLGRIGIDQACAKFHTIVGAGHQCHTNNRVAKEIVQCIEDR